jgi:hypothetical protein
MGETQVSDEILQPGLQPDAEPAAPEAAEPVPASVPARPPKKHGFQPGHTVGHRFGPGNEFGKATRFQVGLPGPRLLHGAKSKIARQQLLDEAAVLLAEQRSEIARDLGGDLSRIGRDLVDRYVETCLLAGHLGSVLTVEGVFTSSGRARRALQAYLQLLDRQIKLAAQLGIERRTKQIDLARVLSGMERG